MADNLNIYSLLTFLCWQFKRTCFRNNGYSEGKNFLKIASIYEKGLYDCYQTEKSERILLGIQAAAVINLR